MLNYKRGCAHTFMGCEDSLDDSHVVVLPVPYDAAASYNTGMRFAPRNIITSSHNIETFDPELGAELIDKVRIHTAHPIEPNLSSPKAMADDVYDVVKQMIELGKFPLILGGDHSISFGPVRAFSEKFPDLTVLQIDAHADLLDEFEGTRYSHACIMRRAEELGVNTIHIGVRSYSQSEHEHMKEAKIIFKAPFRIEQIPKIIEACTDDVYLTIDSDGFDPSLMPGTGTPVPGGLLWYESLALFRELFSKKNVVGMDFVELCPLGTDTRSEDVAAMLLYKLIGYKFKNYLKKST